RVRSRVDGREAWKVLRREHIQLRGVAPTRDVRDAVLGPILDRDLSGRQQPREIDEELARDDDRTVALDARSERGAERELHVGGGQLERAVGGAQEYPGENLDRAA